MEKVKFRRLTKERLEQWYPTIKRVPSRMKLGEVKVPGHGWLPCELGPTNVPIKFCADDEFWLGVPPTAEFEEETRCT